MSPGVGHDSTAAQSEEFYLTVSFVGSVFWSSWKCTGEALGVGRHEGPPPSETLITAVLALFISGVMCGMSHCPSVPKPQCNNKRWHQPGTGVGINKLVRDK